MSREALTAIRADVVKLLERIDEALEGGAEPVGGGPEAEQSQGVDPVLIAELKGDEGRVGRPGKLGGFIHTAYPDPLSPRAQEMRRLGIPLNEASDPRVKHLSGAPWTWGYGHTGADVAEGREGDEGEAEEVLIADVIDHNAELSRRLPWVAQLDPARRRVLQNMAFNLGVGRAGGTKGLLGFKNTLGMIERGQFAMAADGMLKSLWAKQVGQRAVRLANTMRTGT